MQIKNIWDILSRIFGAIVIGFFISILYMIIIGSSYSDFASLIIIGMVFLCFYLISYFMNVISAVIGTLSVVLEYSFGVGADIDECLEKLKKWGEENNIEFEIFKD
jgi:hypothetical protein